MKEIEQNKESGKERKELTPQQRQKRMKLLIYPLFFLLFAGSMWLIFAPSSDQKEKTGQPAGLNTDLPMPKEKGMVENKRDAYEQEAVKQKEKEKKRSLSDFAYLLEEEQSKNGQERRSGTMSKISDRYRNPSSLGNSIQPQSSDRTSAIRSSTSAYQNINKQLGNWNNQPATVVDEQSPSKLENRIQELERKQEEEALRKKIGDDQLEMIEKSYQLAAKYMPGTAAPGVNISAPETSKVPSTPSSGGKVVAQPVQQVRQNVVSLLATPENDQKNAEQDQKPRNSVFLTIAGKEAVTGKNSIRACISQTVTLTNGKELQLRLMEPIQVGDMLIPANTLITGPCRIGGE
ncbi:conjugative transposon protein TraM, partial [bacterium]|nr:conjugative transposon protein TraM [bacterium]